MASSIVNVACVSGIYRIQNTLNGKFYIGSSVNIRWRAHKHLSQLRRGIHHNAYLQSAFNKYGERAFSVEMVECCERSEILEREQSYLDSLSPPYNICKFAANTLGYQHTAESKAKMSIANKGNQRNLGNVHSDDAKRRMSEAASKRTASPETRAKIARAGMGNKSNTGRKLPADHVAKVAAAALRMWSGTDSEDRREVASARIKARWADPVWKAQQAAKIKAGKAARLELEGNHFGSRQHETTKLAQR